MLTANASANAVAIQQSGGRLAPCTHAGVYFMVPRVSDC